jgi:plasmid maintenance system antidote protein VapI
VTRKPTIPREILHQEFLKPLGMSQRALADDLGCDVKVVNRIVDGRTSVTLRWLSSSAPASNGKSPDYFAAFQIEKPCDPDVVQ